MILDFLELVGRLKHLKRTGWTLIGIPEAETVAEHSFRTAIIAMILSDLMGANTEKVLRMALFHDLLEAIVGDIPAPAVKEGLVNIDEEKAFEKAFSSLPKKLKEEYLKLMREFLEGKTLEAKIVKAADKLEQALQAKEYYELHPKSILKRFAQVEIPDLPHAEDLRQKILEVMERYGRRICSHNRGARLSGDGYEEALRSEWRETRERRHRRL